MDASVTQPNISLTRAAHAACMSVRAMRHVTRSVPMLGQPNRLGRQWHRYSVIDVARFAVIARLQSFGIGLAHAIAVLDLGVDGHLGGLAGCGFELPPVMLLDRLNGLALHVSPVGGVLHVTTTRIGAPPMPGASVLILNVGAIAHETLDRLQAASTSTGTTTTHGVLPGGGRECQRAAHPFPQHPDSAGDSGQES